MFWKPGTNYFIRTVTYHAIGKLVEIDNHEIILEDAAWVADSGRWSEALTTGRLEEVEPFPDGQVAIGRNAVVDACVWSHPLVRGVK